MLTCSHAPWYDFAADMPSLIFLATGRKSNVRLCARPYTRKFFLFGPGIVMQDDPFYRSPR